MSASKDGGNVEESCDDRTEKTSAEKVGEPHYAPQRSESRESSKKSRTVVFKWVLEHVGYKKIGQLQMMLVSECNMKYKWSYEVRDEAVNLTTHGYPAFTVEVVTRAGHIHTKGLFGKVNDALSLVEELKKNARDVEDRVLLQVCVFNKFPNHGDKIISVCKE